MLDRTIIIGTTTHIPMTFVDEDGVGIDHTIGTRVTKLRLTPIGSTTPLYTFATTTAAVFTWSDATEGNGTWLFESDVAYVAGTYKASCIYSDTSTTPDDVHELGEAKYFFRNPTTGAL